MSALPSPCALHPAPSPFVARPWPRSAGFSLAELLVASVIGSLVAGGTLAALVTAARIMRARSNPAAVEADLLAEQTIERSRNMIACAPPWFDPSTCAPVAGAGGMPTTWRSDPLLDAQGQPYSVSAAPNSVLAGDATRMFCVIPTDCDGVEGLGPGDCYAIHVRVCWRGTPCPSPGDACP